jgi:imidazole glycerol-phosphate synthase subunit HisH
MKVVIIDYGMGNLASVRRAFTELGVLAVIAEHPGHLADADRILLPGVGSFSDGMRNLLAAGWVEHLQHQVQVARKPIMGICLGMHLLASTGSEGGETPGLNLIPGDVVRLDTLGCTLRIPHVGWNAIRLNRSETPLFTDIPDGTDFYFVHSYAIRPESEKSVLATTDYDIPVVAVIGVEHVLGAQFHPEKSSKAGFRLLKNFIDFGKC